MVEPTRRSRSFIYKRAMLANSRLSLSTLLDRAMDDGEPALARRMKCGPDGESGRLLNTYLKRDPKMLRVGSLFEFTPGSIPSGFRLDPSATELPVEALAQYDSQKQFIESALYFGVLGNHVIVLPSGALGASQLDEYLNWYLTEHTDVLRDGAVKLYDEPLPAVRKRWENVRSITLQENVKPKDIERLGEGPQRRVRGRLMRAVSAAFPTLADTYGRLNAEELDGLAELHVKVEISVASRSRSVDTQLLDYAARMLPDEDAGRYSFFVQGVGPVSAGEVKIRASRKILHVDGLPVLADVASRMHAWLVSLLENDRVGR